MTEIICQSTQLQLIAKDATHIIVQTDFECLCCSSYNFCFHKSNGGQLDSFECTNCRNYFKYFMDDVFEKEEIISNNNLFIHSCKVNTFSIWKIHGKN